MTRGWYIRPSRGQRIKWTHSRYTPLMNNKVETYMCSRKHLSIWNDPVWKLSSIFHSGCFFLILQNSASRPGRFIPGERAPGIHWRGGWVGPRAGLGAVKKIISHPRRGSNPGSPSRSPSPYQLSYPGSCVHFSRKCSLT
jgi:hypothetical protein